MGDFRVQVGLIHLNRGNIQALAEN